MADIGDGRVFVRTPTKPVVAVLGAVRMTTWKKRPGLDSYKSPIMAQSCGFKRPRTHRHSAHHPPSHDYCRPPVVTYNDSWFGRENQGASHLGMYTIFLS